MSEHSTREAGQFAEQLTLEHLLSKGMSLVTRNFLSKVGEIDLIMKSGETLVFVEVRSRENFDDIHPFETVTKVKQGRIIGTAKYYLWTNELYDACDCRFDVVAVNLSNGELDWIENAFEG